VTQAARKWLNTRDTLTLVVFSGFLQFIKCFLDGLLAKLTKGRILRHQNPKMKPETKRKLTHLWKTDSTSFRILYNNIQQSFEPQQMAACPYPSKITNRFRVRSDLICLDLASRLWSLLPSINDFSAFENINSCNQTIKYGITLQALWLSANALGNWTRITINAEHVREKRAEQLRFVSLTTTAWCHETAATTHLSIP
jgi:hypothetical protein